MATYRKTALIEAVQWFKQGDHPAVVMKADRNRYADEGVPWIETLEGGHVVTPGDWIATGVKGEHWPIKPDVFAATYELVPNNPTQVEPVEGLVERLLAPAYWMSGSKDGHEGENTAPFEAATALSQSSEREAKLVAENERLREALEEQVNECFDERCEMCARHEDILRQALAGSDAKQGETK